ncbi:uncharacterized protein LOC125023583 isoform X2 [Mugil cephalus]|uniref:uncharacterized protein LOC125023583 isoform X2 n=1 Tax=Mugil cephalus TaxID=48193 RepID=UPI001FB7738D|nr:uncharacterized protein LOC125023583 isoform X2 [Mugil cephalus]
MDMRGKILSFLLFVTLFIIIFFIEKLTRTNRSVPPPRGPPATCPFSVSNNTITPLRNTKHLLVSAFMDQREKGFDVRIIGIFKRDSIQPLHCFFCCAGWLKKDATTKHTWLPIRNKKTSGKNEKKPQFNFTVCVSNLFGDFNNVLQFAQTLEMYRLLGVNRVVIYNTSCGPELDRLLQSYSKEGFVEMVPWPINKHLKPSGGWLFSEHGGDLHYYGQLATLNECIYRSMERSRYVLLNDIDEIIMPYQHNDLMSLMSTLEQQNPNAQVFLIENHIYPKKPFNESVMGSLPKWRGVPGFNILERVYKEEPDRNVFHPYKMIIQPRAVEQTSVHDVLKMSGQRFKVPPDICRIIHSPIKTPIELPIEQLHVDTRLLNFKDQLSPSLSKIKKGDPYKDPVGNWRGLNA